MTRSYLTRCAYQVITFSKNESGQDLIEYALVIALIALAATAGMSSVAGAINNGFTAIGSILGKYIS